MVMDKPTVGAMARLVRATRCCNEKPTLSWRFKLDKHFLKPPLLVDADRMSDESTGKSLSLDEAEFYVWNLGCAAEMLVMNCWRGLRWSI